MRTHLVRRAARRATSGETVSLCGWVGRRREHGAALAFVDVRDHTGIDAVRRRQRRRRAQRVRRARHRRRSRAPGGHGQRRTCRPARSSSGSAWSRCCARAEPPPFPIDDRADDVDENTRLQYRYLDIRRERMQRNLRIRAAVNSAIRRSMERQGFVEVETPMLVPSTPEGAREFLVPSRKEPGSFYALPQSPQLFKQLLMVAGIDRYYQIARCLRDEDLRADRQYEFMQLDVEMSFVDQDDVLAAISEAVLDAAEAVTGERPPTIERITWREAMDRFGVDKPDLRFGMELVELTDVFAATEFKAFAGAGVDQGHPRRRAGRGVRPQQARRAHRPGQEDRRQGPRLAEGRRRRRARVTGRQVPRRETEQAALRRAPRRRAGRPRADRRRRVDDDVRGARAAAQRPRPPAGVTRARTATCGSIDFPLFVGVDEETGRPKPGHHPFCRPHPDDLDQFETDPLQVRALAYDLVLNGWELGSGSIRIHEPRAAAQVFDAARHQRRGGRPQVRLLPPPVHATARRRTAGSRSASTASSRSSPARRTSAR